MPKSVSFVRLVMLVLFLATALPAAAQTTKSATSAESRTPLRASLLRHVEAREWKTKAPARSTLAPQQSKPAQRQSFAKRHPVWTGALIGCAVGTAVAAKAWGREAAFVGFYGGAAVGAFVGSVVSR